ncbi:SecY-interacting protein [Neptunomonas japonica]|uniref:SecY-interacting protein n=1 Tax=Neptunomonas japonica TaxID=417574 RepID=UPI0004240E6B|nr:SecY-interacting protein [Neptunomonas japonica]
MQISDALDSFVNAWQAFHDNTPPTIAFDSEWPSLCYNASSPQEGELISWQPRKQTTACDVFTRLGEALETTIHPDIIAYYTYLWSDHLDATAPDGDLTLLQVWNEEDIERLRANLIGHAMVKVKKKLPLTLFFACTEPDDGMLSLLNDDGSIWLEYPGKKPVKKIAESLSEFLNQLTPR